MDELELEDYFGDVAVPSSEEENDAANDETFGADADDVVAGDPESDVAWKLGHEELAARIEREREAILRRQDALGPVPGAGAEPAAPATGAAGGAMLPLHLQQQQPQQPQQQEQPHLSAVYMHQAQIQQHQYAMMQQQQCAFAEQQRRVMLQHREYLQLNPAAAPQLHEQQQQMIVHHQQQMAQMQHQLQARQAALAQMQVTMQAQARAAPQQRQLHPLQQQQQQVAAAGAASLPPPPPPGVRAQGGRMEQIEREMAAAGLGPAGAAQRKAADAELRGGARSAPAPEGIEASLVGDARAAAARLQSPDSAANGGHTSRDRGGPGGPGGPGGRGSGPRLPAGRRLESMTDRDMEIVLRMHLRQLETAVPYKDEYYAFAMREREATGATDSFERLAAIVSELTGASGRGANGKRSTPKGARRVATDVGECGDDDDARSLASTTHAPENLSTLATALGTLQVWNPKAPRKLVDFGGKAGGPSAPGQTTDAGSTLQKASGGTKRAATPDKLLREDERIVVRSAVEEGYDVFAALHDVARRKASAPVDPLIKSLFGVLRLPSTPGAAASPDTDAFLVRMCGFAKGMQFVARAFAVLKAPQKLLVACCVMRNLHLLVRAEALSHAEEAHAESFWTAMAAYVREGASDPQVAVDMLRHFDDAHKDRPECVVAAMGSTAGASLVYVAMQRLFGALNGSQFEADMVADVSGIMGALCDTVEESLGDIFEQTQSSAGVWQVAAMLDALAPAGQQAKLRSTLRRLLEDGTAPPPPAA
jgi:hypothetical protein